MDPTIVAARITSEATIHAAWIQGGFTFTAGFLALIGGGLTLLGAILAARRQVRLNEQRDAARVAAYRVRIEVVANDLLLNVVICLNEAESALRQYKVRGGHYTITILPLYQVPDFAEEHWETHALLGLVVVRAIHQARVKLIEYTKFQDEVIEDELACDDQTSRVFTFRSKTENADGSVTFECENVVEANVTLLSALKCSIDELKTSLQVEK